MYRIVDDTIDPYKNMVIDAMRMNQGHTGQCPIIDEELNVDVARFFYFFERF